MSQFGRLYYVYLEYAHFAGCPSRFRLLWSRSKDSKFILGDRNRMKRNPVAWAALIVASAALFSSSGFLRQMPAAPKVTEEGQRTAKALSQAFGAVAEFARPSVVQIVVQKKGGSLP